MSDTDSPYDMGYDCGLNGASTTNCSFWLFSTTQKMKAWEWGKRDGEAEKEKRALAQAPPTNEKD